MRAHRLTGDSHADGAIGACAAHQPHRAGSCRQRDRLQHVVAARVDVVVVEGRGGEERTGRTLANGLALCIDEEPERFVHELTPLVDVDGHDRLAAGLLQLVPHIPQAVHVGVVQVEDRIEW
jgi:hypothetical protein